MVAAKKKKMTNQEIATALGGSTNGPWINVPGPGHSSGDASLGFRFDPLRPSRIRINSFAGDDRNTCRQHVIERLASVSGGASSVIKNAHLEAVDQAGIFTTAKALPLWAAAVSAVGTLAERYLATRCCLPCCLPLSKTCLTEVLRFHPYCWMGAERVPAMIAMMRDAITGEFTGVHRTALNDDGSGKRTMPGGKSAKMMLGRAKGAVVMLSPGAPRMGIAEGIETALSAQILSGIPVWACLSDGGVANFPNISGLEHLTIFADHDAPGLSAAHRCARRYASAGTNAEIRHPPKTGTDWNDYLVKESR